ncbi:MarR family winged helix-turn-helix transcriptional regulator [Desulfosediminicola sp.]|uniref:MarR family winged helix-turn-helix transcriptional regulator n=1 Tax=Desulfosediminicola sp. TaxID=2886825 RepID=UPI003AF278D1
MHNEEFMDKVSVIVETDGLLRDYITSVVIKDIKSRISDNRFTSLNSNHIHAALLLKAIAPCALKDFAALMRLSKSAASALVERMVENSLVVRQPNPHNRREILLSVSPDFEEHVVFVRAELANWFASLIEDLGEETFEQWFSVMQQLNTVILQKIRSPHT